MKWGLKFGIDWTDKALESVYILYIAILQNIFVHFINYLYYSTLQFHKIEPWCVIECFIK